MLSVPESLLIQRHLVLDLHPSWELLGLEPEELMALFLAVECFHNGSSYRVR